jgi:HEAT repeat protein
MQDIRRARLLLTLLIVGGTGAWAQISAEEVRLLDPATTPWYVYVATGPQPDAEAALGQLAPANWSAADFDDSHWGRYCGELKQLTGVKGQAPVESFGVLCLRTRFGITDPARVKDLTLTITCGGRTAVFVNGKRVTSPHAPVPVKQAPPGQRTGGAVAPPPTRPLYTVTLPIPRETMRSGANSLAVAVLPPAVFEDARLTSTSRTGVVPCEDTESWLQVWNATPFEAVSKTARARVGAWVSWVNCLEAVQPGGVARGSPFDPVRPVRMVGARRGSCSGQIVVTSAAALFDLKAEIGPLVHPGGVSLPAGAVRIRYAAQGETDWYFDGLASAAEAGAKVQPVWILADIPKDQPPGWYTGWLTVDAAGTTFRVPVQVLVCGWTLPERKDYRTFVSMPQSPDSLAHHYGVAPWSDEHFALIEKSLALLGLVGNDVAHVGVAGRSHMNHQYGLVRWVRQGDKLEPDFSAMNRYLDLYVKHCGPPKVINVMIWSPPNNAGGKIIVTGWDPKTGKMWPMRAPTYDELSEGSETFWKAFTDGLREQLRRRGWDASRVALAQGFDDRPHKRYVEFFKKIAPDFRWAIFAHWFGDPDPETGHKDGAFFTAGGMEVAYGESPSCGVLPELYPENAKIQGRRYHTSGSHRMIMQGWTPLPGFRNLTDSGTFGQVGLDCWEGFGRWSGPILYRTNPGSIIPPGREGPITSTRFEMTREGVQETEARIFITQAMLKMPDDRRSKYRQILDAWKHVRSLASVLPQAQSSPDVQAMAWRIYAAAAEIAGEKTEGEWTAPPAVAGHSEDRWLKPALEASARVAAALELRGLSGDPAATAALVKLSADKDADVRSLALWALGAVPSGSPEAVAALQAAIQDKCPLIRGVAIESLARRSESGTAVLLGAAGDSRVDVRWQAVKALGSRAKEEKVLAVLLEAAKDKDARVRLAAIAAVSEAAGSGQEHAYAGCLAAAEDEDQAVRDTALRALARLTRAKPPILPDAKTLSRWPQSTLQHAADLIRIKDQDIGYGAGQLLTLAGARAVPILAERVHEADDRVAWRAVWALGRLGPAAKDALPAIQEEAQWRADGTFKTMAKDAAKQIEKQAGANP